MSQFCKIGFHAGVGGNRTGIGDYMRRLDAAGIPLSVKGADDAGLAVEAAQYARSSGVRHNILLRFTQPGGAHDDVPDFSLPPEQAAREHWQRVKQSIPPEIEPIKDLIWIEPTNEIDTHTRAAWLGWFCYHIGRIANADGYKVALAGFNAGQPEPDHWQLPGFKRYLADCAARPDQVAISIHEAKLTDMHAPPQSFVPQLLGRFLYLFATCDLLGLARPTVFISEWAWSYNTMPEPDKAMDDVKWLCRFLARYPTVRGVFLWNLGGGSQWSDLPHKLQRLIAPITQHTLNTAFDEPEDAPLPAEVKVALIENEDEEQPEEEKETENPDDHSKPVQHRGQPREQYERTYILLPPNASEAWATAAVQATWDDRRYTVGASADDAGIGDLDKKTVIAVNPAAWGDGEDGQGLAGFYRKYYPHTRYRAIEAASPADLRNQLARL